MTPLFHVDGIENAVDAFSRMDTLLLGEQLLQVFQIAGDAVAERARGIVRVRSGRLQGAIFARAYRKDTVPYVIIGVETQEPAWGHEIVPYGGYEEFGTKFMEGHPYIREAAAQMEGELLQNVGAAIGALLAL